MEDREVLFYFSAINASSTLYLPVAQATQADATLEPVAALDVPATQAVHAVAKVDAVAVLYLPAAHEVQELCPVEAWYLPVPHKVHADVVPTEYL